jgi:4-hydroxybenzoate polyprenyltransferase
MGFIGNFIGNIENSKKSLCFFIWLWIAVITTRNVVEPISTGFGWALRFMVHYSLWYGCLATFLVIVVHLVTKAEIIKVARIVLFTFFLIILAPLIDLVITGGYQMEYFMPHKDDLWERYVYSMFIHKKGPGASLGQRIEIGIVLVCSFIYVSHKTRSFIRSLIGLLAVYNVIFFLSALPFFLYWFSLLIGVSVPPDQTILLTKAIVILGFFAIHGLFCVWNRKLYWAMLKNLRWLRLAHYLLMVLVGMALAGFHIGAINLVIALNLVLVTMSFTFASFHAIAINDIHDVQIDKISNPRRPLVTKVISKKTYGLLAQVALWLGLLYAAVAGTAPFIVVVIILLNYYLYSAPPLRLKRYLYGSKLLISLNTLLSLLLGYALMDKDILEFPKSIIAFVLIVYTACINFIDIKDYEGDKKARIRTLPVVLGLNKSKKLTGIFFIIAYGIFSCSYDIFHLTINRQLFIAISLICGILEYLLITRNKYNEMPVFWVYEFSLIFLILIMVQ